VDYEKALHFMQTAKEIGTKKGVTVSVAIVDAAGHPVLVARGKPEAWHGPYMATGKARLASAFRKGTAALMDQWADRPMFPMSLTEVIPGGVTLNKGGYPIFEDGVCIGAIGVGGSSPDSDDEVARLTVEAFGAGAPAAGKTKARKEAIQTDNAPTPTGPFSQAIRVGNLVFTAGQAGRNRETGKMGDIRDQARRCIGNLSGVLEAAGSSLADIVKVNVHLRRAEDWAPFNEEYVKLIPAPLPARSSAIVGLRGDDMLVEVEVVAVVSA
jgi:2-iminobutanoate/2-iminopropanoate deaminase